jgi:hypothetical protein
LDSYSSRGIDFPLLETILTGKIVRSGQTGMKKVAGCRLPVSASRSKDEDPEYWLSERGGDQYTG